MDPGVEDTEPIKANKFEHLVVQITILTTVDYVSLAMIIYDLIEGKKSVKELCCCSYYMMCFIDTFTILFAFLLLE